MSDYSTQTVAQLKDLLKSRSLPVDGKKSDLVSRLELADKSSAENNNDDEDDDGLLPVEGVDPQVPSTAEPTTKDETAAVGDDASKNDTSKNDTSPSTTAHAPDSPVPEKKQDPPLTPEERKQKALAFLETKIRRAQKFGDDAAAAETKRVMARVEKFGVELGTALLVEIGLEPPKTANVKRPRGDRKGGRKRQRRN